MIAANYGIIVAFLLFIIGGLGLIIRRNMIFMLMSLEIMLNAAAMAFIVAGSAWQQGEGQIMYIFIITLAAAEASIGLVLLIKLYQKFKTVDIDSISEMKG